MTQINTISEFLLHAGTDYRVFDMARAIRPVSSQVFLEIENALQPAPFPKQQHAWFGVLFFNKQLSNEQYIWFVKLPLDEQGLIISAGRQQFLEIVVKALGQQLDNKNNPNNQLPDNPFTFVPTQQQLADFNSICRVELDLPLSEHFSTATHYLNNPSENDWHNVPLQGIADFTASITQGSLGNLYIKQFSKLAPEIQHALCASLENHPHCHEISGLLIDWYRQQPTDEKRLQSVLRGLCQSQDHSAVKYFLKSILVSDQKHVNSVLMLIAARHWLHLTDSDILKPYIELLANSDIDTFTGLYSDLVQIPAIRQTMLSVLRWPEKSSSLTQAIGQLFGQNTR